MGVLEQKLCVDQQLAEEDARPPPQPERVEDRDPEPDRRPDRRDGRGVAQGLPELGRAEVERPEQDDPGDVANGGPAKRRGGRLRGKLSGS
jgi:hypothetical protein